MKARDDSERGDTLSPFWTEYFADTMLRRDLFPLTTRIAYILVAKESFMGDKSVVAGKRFELLKHAEAKITPERRQTQHSSLPRVMGNRSISSMRHVFRQFSGRKRKDYMA